MASWSTINNAYRFADVGDVDVEKLKRRLQAFGQKAKLAQISMHRGELRGDGLDLWYGFAKDCDTFHEFTRKEQCLADVTADGWDCKWQQMEIIIEWNDNKQWYHLHCWGKRQTCIPSQSLINSWIWVKNLSLSLAFEVVADSDLMALRKKRQTSYHRVTVDNMAQLTTRWECRRCGEECPAGKWSRRTCEQLFACSCSTPKPSFSNLSERNANIKQLLEGEKLPQNLLSFVVSAARMHSTTSIFPSRWWLQFL